MIMLECWRGEPSERPTFSCLVERLVSMLEAGTDLVDGQATGEDDQDIDSLSQVSTDTDDGLLLVSEFHQDSADEHHENSCRVTFRMLNSPEDSQVRFVRSRETELELEHSTLQTEDRPRAVNLAQMEAISEDSGFGPSPKVSESGSEMAGTPLKQSHPVFFGKFEQENFSEVTPPSIPFHTLATAVGGRQNLEVLDNDVFDADPVGEDPHQQCVQCEDLRSSKNTLHDPVTREQLSPQTRHCRSKSMSFVEFTKSLSNNDISNWRGCRSNPNLAIPEEETTMTFRGGLEKQDTISSENYPLPAATKTSHRYTHAVKKERRKAVVTPPTLALDNEMYLAVGKIFQQLPPPLQITRRTKTRDVPDEDALSRRSSAASSCCASRNASDGQNVLFPGSMLKQSAKSEGIFHRVLVQVHRPPSFSSTQDSTPKDFPKHGTHSHAKPDVTPVQIMSTFSTGKVVERGNRKFVRPQDISIQISDNVENESNLSANKNKAQQSKDAQNLDTGGSFLKQTPHRNSCKESSSPRMPVSPVRYVHFRFPSAQPNSSYKRSLSENNILACAATTAEFVGFPKTFRNLTLLSESSSTTFPESTCPRDDNTLATQAVDIIGHGFIPVRRFSDPSSLPVSIEHWLYAAILKSWHNFFSILLQILNHVFHDS
ncbi:vascular endothelial growth factor receptor 2 [Elysia marginata]|uniref:Vascular endothelial growth factor receptor 2 n=1 Tax=Elysia marginata TaxID=1093978 RepID=A0AAV4HD76_9GAST|nr:vascular endothelial growth factor receptor 2 [Elysia marginata]